MCGRLNVTDSPDVIEMCNQLGINFTTTANADLRPTNSLDLITGAGQIHTKWGIKPEWSDRLLINAQAEKMASSRLWKPAFHQQRCLVPCLGWYEWRSEGGEKKQKYLFTSPGKKPLFMAALYWPEGVYAEQATAVTLTTVPNKYCAQYHNRMPVIIPAEQADWWLNGRVEGLAPLLMALPEKAIVATAA